MGDGWVGDGTEPEEGMGMFFFKDTNMLDIAILPLGKGGVLQFVTIRWWLRLLVIEEMTFPFLTCGRRWDVFKTSVYTFQVFQIGPSVESRKVGKSWSSCGQAEKYVNSEKVQLKGRIVSRFWMICLYVSSWRLMVIYMLLHERSKLIISRRWLPSFITCE